jgi:hypothetical protein
MEAKQKIAESQSCSCRCRVCAGQLEKANRFPGRWRTTKQQEAQCGKIGLLADRERVQRMRDSSEDRDRCQARTVAPKDGSQEGGLIDQEKASGPASHGQ